MRTPYKIGTCDSCRQEIEKANDENDVKMNGAIYLFCPTCYDELQNFVVDLVTRPPQRDKKG